MEALIWDQRYVTGEPVVDQEHQELVRIINWAADLQASARSVAEIGAVLDTLVGYADTHFRHEEELMASVACDRRHVEMHIAIHRDFSAQILKLHDAPIYSDDIAHLLRFLTGWLTNHILSIDQAMARQVRSIRAGMSPEEAYSREAKGLGDPATLSLFTAMDSLSRLLASRNDTLLTLNHQLEGVVSERSRAQELLAQIIDGDPVATFVLDAEHRITHWNKACALVTQVPASEIVGMTGPWRAFYEHERPVMADLIISGALEDGISSYYAGKYRASPLIPGAFEAEDFFPRFGDGGCWMFFTAAPLKDADGRIIGAIETLQDVTERRNAEQELRNAQASLEELVEKRTQQLAEANRTLEDDIKRREQAEQELLRRYGELTQLNAKLTETKQQLMQSEKLASIGQLAAGVAHEINNPIGYVHSNIGALENYLKDVFEMLDAYEAAEAGIGDRERAAQLAGLRSRLDIDFLREDIPMLMRESKEGITRVKKIVQDLKDFSRVDSSDEFQWADLHQGLDSTLNIVANEIKYKADVVREYGELPDVECLPSQLNQVFMNLCVNAAHAMGETRGRIVIRTGRRDDSVWIEVADNGCGIAPENLSRIFDPFFTTKPVGKGTGLGLSLSYGIVQNHKGNLEVESRVGEGTTFRITLPIRHATSETGEAA
ncbi:MAG: PAS domain-containing protein [Candidatus Accumulibacter sp.]|mgnify:FL=1|nr:PAS domain-containing protein [Accumulibacter sp.]